MNKKLKVLASLIVVLLTAICVYIGTQKVILSKADQVTSNLANENIASVSRGGAFS